MHTGSTTVNVNLPRRGSSLGIASIVLGILAFVICWIPFVGLLGTPLSAFGLLLGLIGLVIALFRKGSGIGLALGGVAICALSLTIAVTFTHAVSSGITNVTHRMEERAAAERATNQRVIGEKTQAPTEAVGPAAHPQPAVTDVKPARPEISTSTHAGSPSASKPGDDHVPKPPEPQVWSQHAAVGTGRTSGPINFHWHELPTRPGFASNQVGITLIHLLGYLSSESVQAGRSPDRDAKSLREKQVLSRREPMEHVMHAR